MIRVLSGVVLAAAFFAIAWYASAVVLTWIAIGVCALAFHEYATILRRIGVSVPWWPTLAATLAALAAVPFPYVAIEAVLAVGLVIIASAAMVLASRVQTTTTDVQAENPAATTIFTRAAQATAAGALALVYLGIPLGSLVGVHIVGGRGAVLLLVFTIVVSDSAQYYAGRLLGRHPLAAALSPKKTIEGAIGGFVMAPVFLYFMGPAGVPVATGATIAPLGVALVAAGIAGDLFESMLKRAAALKDSSTLIPGHGGVLDRIDALLFATPIFYLYLRWVYAGR
jgi:phosphatidate cytidylyltransferase